MSDLPVHIGYIVDGNRRWAKKYGLPTYEGHLAGYNQLKEVGLATLEAGVKYMSAYVFSTENWKRSEDEVSYLMKLFLKVLRADIELFVERNIQLKVIGSREGFSDKLCQAIDDAEDRTRHMTGGTLALCLNYGGHLEIAEACKKIIQLGISADEVTPQLVEQNLYAPHVPPMDLMVRTSGEQRLSNFMLWRAAYSELLFLDKLWPEMTKDDVGTILKEYARRQRRFGG